MYRPEEKYREPLCSSRDHNAASKKLRQRGIPRLRLESGL
jgi:hypothetical protein